MNDKLEQVQKQLEEIAKLDLEAQPEAFTKLHEDLDAELNRPESDSNHQ